MRERPLNRFSTWCISLQKFYYTESIAGKCFRALSGLFSPNQIGQSSCTMGLVLACVVRILHDDRSIRLGENRPRRVLKHLAAMLRLSGIYY